MSILLTALLAVGTTHALEAPLDTHLAVVYVDRTTLPDDASMQSLLAAEGVKLAPTDDMSGPVNENISDSFYSNLEGGGTVMVSMLREPPEWLDLQTHLVNTSHWPEAATELAAVQATVYVMGTDLSGDLRDQNRTMSRIVDALTQMEGTRAVVWLQTGHLWSPKSFHIVEDAFNTPDHLPVQLWTTLSIVPAGEGRLSILSFGMEHFGYDNFLVECREEDLTDATTFIHATAEYVIRDDVQIQKKDTIAYLNDTTLVFGRKKSPVEKRAKVLTLTIP